MNPNPNITLRLADSRGHGSHGWLDSRHTFSFGEYRDPAHSGFRSLRVINQDKVAAGGGFPTHPHRDMEIFSYVLEGRLAHQDSMGNQRELHPGEIQLMGAGSGVTHSEFNPSPTEPLHFLQIWIHPECVNLPPTYSEWKPAAEAANASLTLLISPDGADGSAVIRQDARVHRLRLAADETVDFPLADGRGLWLQMIDGRLDIEGHVLGPGDGACCETPGQLSLRALEDLEALVFDLGRWPT